MPRFCHTIGISGLSRVLTLTIQSEPRLELRTPTKRAKWRSSMSAHRSVAQKLVDSADIVRDRDVTPVEKCRMMQSRLEQGLQQELWVVTAEKLKL
jgi:hypothetical protein